MLNEKRLIEELNRFDTDELYVREKCGIETKGELSTFEEMLLEKSIPKIRRQIKEELFEIQNWNKKAESNVPLRFSEVSFFNYQCSNDAEKNILASVIHFVEKENNDGVLMLTGKRGTGKTHLGISAVRDKKGFYIGMEDLIYKIESSLNFKSEKTEEQVFDDFSTKRFLVIDEIGRSLKREKEIEILSYILRKRYDNKLPTIIISNLDKKTLLTNLGEAVADRLCETGTSVEFSGESYRVLKRKEANCTA